MPRIQREGRAILRGEGRGVSDYYGVRDAACPLSTREGGGEGGAPPVLSAGAAALGCGGARGGAAQETARASVQ